jgi:hypothetical protein
MFQTKVVDKIETHILISIYFFFSKTSPFLDNVGYFTAENTTDNTAHAHGMLDTYGY